MGEYWHFLPSEIIFTSLGLKFIKVPKYTFLIHGRLTGNGKGEIEAWYDHSGSERTELFRISYSRSYQMVHGPFEYPLILTSWIQAPFIPWYFEFLNDTNQSLASNYCYHRQCSNLGDKPHNSTVHIILTI